MLTHEQNLNWMYSVSFLKFRLSLVDIWAEHLEMILLETSSSDMFSGLKLWVASDLQGLACGQNILQAGWL